jgi:hypothetical protein
MAVQAAYAANRNSRELIANGKYAEAEKLILRTLKDVDGRFGPEHVLWQSLRRQYADTLFHNGRKELAAREYQKVLQNVLVALPHYSSCIAGVRLALAESLCAVEEFASAQEHFKNASGFYEQYGEFHAEFLKCQLGLLQLAIAMGNVQNASEHLDACEGLHRKHHRYDRPGELRLQTSRNALLSHQDQFQQASLGCDAIEQAVGNLESAASVLLSESHKREGRRCFSPWKIMSPRELSLKAC